MQNGNSDQGILIGQNSLREKTLPPAGLNLGGGNEQPRLRGNKGEYQWQNLLRGGPSPLSRVRRAPVLRKQLSDLVDGMIRQASENIAQIGDRWLNHRLATAMHAGLTRGLRDNLGFILVSVA